ncbi:deoxyuridine 5'-triphosphate nucleotidohydrolase-like [Hydra vulgaris]|uniref:Deoxyuridine 5'-triphosphate nucleotidohydrolase-like n=1 Tax=Hydra vulgaris TaxID=6087 RepID=A0ABM4CA25_HYDVU
MADEEKRFYENTRLEIVKKIYKYYNTAVPLDDSKCQEYYDKKLMIKIRNTEKWSFYETKDSACFDLRSIAYKYGVAVFNAPAIIDADYKDEIKVLLYNISEEDYIINRGDAVAQMGFMKTLKSLK